MINTTPETTPPVVVKEAKLTDTARGRRTLKAQKQAEANTRKGISNQQPDRTRFLRLGAAETPPGMCRVFADEVVEELLLRSKSIPGRRDSSWKVIVERAPLLGTSVEM